jgi:hypothetical protein
MYDIAIIISLFRGWAVRIHRILTEESGNSDKDFHMPVFALIFTKFKKNPKLPKVKQVEKL